MKRNFFAFTLMAIASARAYDSFLHFNGNTSTPPFDDSTFSSAPRDATREVAFDFGNGQNWTWTLSTSQVANSTFAPDALFAYTTYSFDWPLDGNVNDAVSSATRNYLDLGVDTQCLYNVWADFPQRVSNAWDSTSSDCSSAIGNECVQYLLQNMRNTSGCSSSNFPTRVQTESPCESSFGESPWVVSLGYPFGNASAPANETTFEKGDTVAWTLNDPYSSDNSTAYEMAKNRLHMVVLRNRYGKQVLCNRVGNAGTRQGRVNMMFLTVVAMFVASFAGL